MRVAYIVSRFPHLPETFILREMNMLVKMGCQIDLYPLVVQDQKVLHPDAQMWLDRLHLVRYFSWATWTANVRMLVRMPLKYFSLLFQIAWFNLASPKFFVRAVFIFPMAVRMAEEMSAQSVNHIHAHYATHPALAAYIISELTQIPFSVSVHAHDIFVDRTMLARKLRKAAFIRSISLFNLNFLSLHCGKWVEEKTFVIHCGIQPEKYAESGKKSSNRFRILSIGSLQLYKGQEILIAACQKIKVNGYEFKCLILGDGELRNYLYNLINGMDLNQEVELLGARTEKEVADYLTGSQCYVQPSVIARSGKMEGIPVAIMEALASKLPVIASGISGIPELIRDGQTGLSFPPGDADALADKLIWVMEHPSESKKMAERGYQLVCKDFNLEKNTAQLAKLFIDHKKNNNGR